MLAFLHDEIAWLRWQFVSLNSSGKRGAGERPQPGSPKAEHDATRPHLLLAPPEPEPEMPADPIAALKAFLN